MSSALTKQIVLNLDIDSAEAMFRQALALERNGARVEAERIYERMMLRYTDHVGAHLRLAGLQLQAGRAERAADLIAKALTLAPADPQAHASLGYALSALKRFDESEASYGCAVALNPSFAEAHYSRGVMRDALQRYEDAAASYDAAIRIKPDYAAAHANRGAALCDLQRFEEALESLQTAIALAPNNAFAHYNRGNSLVGLKRYEDAVASYDAAIALMPGHLLAHNNRGIALTELERHAEALASFDKIILLAPGYAEAHVNRAIVLSNLCDFEGALLAFDRAIAIAPQSAKAHYGRAVALNALKRYAAALESYLQTFALAPDSPFLLGKIVHMKMAICDWNGLDELIAHLEAGITRGERVSPPFQILPFSESPSLQRRASEIYVAEALALSSALPPIAKYERRERIRLAYFSADFHDHATALLMANVFELHSRAQFEITAFSFGPETNDPVRQRLRHAFDNFVDVRNLPDKEVAMLARSLEIDIAVDLKGYTGGERHRIFAHRAAPIQVAYLGYPGTMGAPYMDYLIADEMIIPRTDWAHYTEKVVALPNSYQANGADRLIAKETPSRAKVGLPQDAFVFCSFNNNFKITPATFDRWMDILRKAESAVLWLLEDNAKAAANLKAEAALRGVAPERLVFSARTSLPNHLARHRLADLFLDTYPYNAHTTASDALWAGLPVLTLIGPTFPGRVAASLLKAVDLPELITTTAADYESLALLMAREPARVAAIKDKLARNLSTTPLYDAPRFAKALEAAYVAMYESYHHAGRAPKQEMLRPKVSD